LRSGSDFGKVSILVPAPNPDLDYNGLKHSFSKKIVRQFCLFNVKAVFFARKSSSHFKFFDFWILCWHFWRPECIPVPVPLMQKVAVPAVPVPQHCS
jgi:hypothetical protein